MRNSKKEMDVLSGYNKYMKKSLLSSVTLCFLASCGTFDIAPQPLPGGTSIPSQTPVVITATPIILIPTNASTTPAIFTVTSTQIASSETPTNTATPIPFTNTPTQSVQVDILGCNTSIDVVHGMGEVTNAYVTVKNTGTIDLPNTCSLLRAIDEDREHPDKKACVPNLPAQNQVTFKLTVDSGYKQDTVIQVDTSSNDILILRIDRQSCEDIGLFGGAPTDVGVIKPLQ
ncbi:MAG: hypothetical protein JNM55_12405 [Anaerolineales bacterium]|nr:hypothetical protein [Anaerolineales bacterium]